MIPRRFRGPMNSANGGYACGRIAPFVDAETVEVTLLLPPPLETPLRVEPAGDGVRVFDGEALVAEGRPAELTLDVPDAPDFVEASRVSAAQAVDANHPFPGCFTCGPAREEGDGLRLRPGAAGGGLVVAPYRPADTAPELVWAALDCPGAYAVDPGFARGVSVLGRLTGRILGAPAAGDECVVVAWPLGGEGRRRYAGTALFREGELLALAEAVWFLVNEGVRDADTLPQVNAA